MREVVNALLYLNRSGCQWDMLPHDLPPKCTAYEYFARWRPDVLGGLDREAFPRLEVVWGDSKYHDLADGRGNFGS